jgi:integrase
VSTGTVKKDLERGTWWFVVDARPLGGKRRQIRRRGFATKKEAQHALDQLRKEMTSGRGVDPNRLTVRAFLTDTWLPHLERDDSIKDTTRASYRNATRHLKAHLGDLRLSELRGDDLDSLYEHMKKEGKSASLRRTVHITAHKMLADAVRWRLVAYNAADDASPPSQPRARPRAWTPDQVRTFLDIASQDRWAALWHLAATTAARRGELVGLRWSDLNLETGELAIQRNVTTADHEVVVSTPKTGRARNVSLDPGSVQILKAHRSRQVEELLRLGEQRPDHDYMFTWEDGTLVHPLIITKRFRKLTDSAGLPPLRLHNLRHAWVTSALALGVDIGDISLRLGHSSVRTTYDIYAVPSTERDAAAACAVADLYGAR